MTEGKKCEFCGHARMEYNKITDNVWIGTNQCCQTGFKEELLDKGITVDISLEEEKLDSPFGIETFLWLPTKDHYPPSEDNFLIGVHVISDAVKQNRRVYVHCKHGHTRAPTLVAAFFVSQGMSVDEAVARIKERRPEIHIMPAQMEALKRLEK